jgi:hypothetical protein
LENKNFDIESLFDKLSSFEANPDPDPWDEIKERIHPIDFFIADKVGSLDIETANNIKESIFNEINSQNTLDHLLSKNFLNLEIDPEKTIHEIFPKKRNYKKAIFLFLLFLTGIISGIFLILKPALNIKHKSNEEAEIINPVSKTETTNHSEFKSKTKDEETNELSKLKDAFNQPISHAKHYSHPEIWNQNDESEINSKLTLIKNKISYQAEALQNIDLNKTILKSKRIKKDGLFNIFIGLGYQNQSLQNTQIDQPEFHHKDALDNFKNSVGTNLSGIQINGGIGFPLNNKIFIRAGLQFNYSSQSKQFEYLYTEIPVYGIDGKIIGYLNRPVNGSTHVDQIIKTNTFNLCLPIETMVQIINKGKNKIYLGIGLDIDLYKQFNSVNFSFSEEKLNAIKLQTKQWVKPSFGIMYQYKLNAKINLLLQYQGKKTNAKAFFDQTNFHSTYFISTISAGVILSPKF